MEGVHGVLTMAEANMKLRAFRGGNGSYVVFLIYRMLWKIHLSICDRYLLRIPSDRPGQLALAVMYNEKPTHHILDVSAHGFFCVNQHEYGRTPDLRLFLQTLGRVHSGWPVPLTTAVPYVMMSAV